MNEGLSEFIGAFIGDGCLSCYERKDRPSNVKVIMFTGNWEKDHNYYLKVISPILKKEFNVSGNVYHRRDYNTVRFSVYNKIVVKFLIDRGFKFGPKRFDVYIPSVILEDNILSLSCLRGIFNTDGGIYNRYSRAYPGHKKAYLNYKIVQIKSNSLTLIKQIVKICLRNNIHPNKILKNLNTYVFRITSQKDVLKFLKLIKLNHEYHKTRVSGLEGI